MKNLRYIAILIALSIVIASAIQSKEHGCQEVTLLCPNGKDHSFCNIHAVPTIYCGSFSSFQNKPDKIFDITGHEIHALDQVPGIYSIEVDGEMREKVKKLNDISVIYFFISIIDTVTCKIEAVEERNRKQ